MPPSRTQPTGSWIFKTDARKRYKLSDADLASLTPLSVLPNPRGGPHPVVKYSERDVQALARRLKEAATAAGPSSDGDLAKPNGKEILHTKAKNEYGLTTEQLRAIKPTRIEPNPYGDRLPPMKHYNLCDVVALAERLAAARTQSASSSSAAASSSRPARSPKKGRRAKRSPSPYEDYDGDWDGDGAFDGMSPDDAHAKLMGIFHDYGMH
ncbi:hypothetical protein PsYK624_141940 [Phanerochaete sordida]|uniref:Uncharacterized protein n=1 Tax=Phanerochaete sordida TaxID=48140 RepID=A0A9P3GM54_9APHY|nr:hypothetical protein PsYK624_141940 [Phanerochaete sordida]